MKHRPHYLPVALAAALVVLLATAAVPAALSSASQPLGPAAPGDPVGAVDVGVKKKPGGIAKQLEAPEGADGFIATITTPAYNVVKRYERRSFSATALFTSLSKAELPGGKPTSYGTLKQAPFAPWGCCTDPRNTYAATYKKVPSFSMTFACTATIPQARALNPTSTLNCSASSWRPNAGNAGNAGIQRQKLPQEARLAPNAATLFLSGGAVLTRIEWTTDGDLMVAIKEKGIQVFRMAEGLNEVVSIATTKVVD